MTSCRNGCGIVVCWGAPSPWSSGIIINARRPVDTAPRLKLCVGRLLPRLLSVLLCADGGVIASRLHIYNRFQSLLLVLLLLLQLPPLESRKLCSSKLLLLQLLLL